MAGTSTLPAYYLSEVKEDSFKEWVPLEFGSDGTRVRMRSPVLTPELLSRIISDLMKAQADYLAHLPVFEIVETISKVVNLWSDPEYPPRKLALKFLPAITGFSTPMIELILGEIYSMFTTQNLKLLLADEFEDPRVLDEFRPRKRSGGYIRAYGPALTTIVFAGNAPGLPMVNTVYSLLLKSAVLGKSASEEPLFSSLFAQSIADVDPQLAKCIAMVLWKGGNEEIERLAFSKSDAVVAYGSEHSVNEVRKRVPPNVKLISYGHKLSFGVIGREALSTTSIRKTAADAAANVSILDQQGCISPHVFYAEEGGEITPKEFSGYLAEAMEEFNKRIPRGRITPDESAHINQLRGAYEFREFGDDGVALYTSPQGTSWTVIYEQDPTFIPSCLNRTIRVKPVKDVMNVVKLVTSIKAYLQTMGAALPQERLMPLAEEMGKLGLDRIPKLGNMAGPSVLWRHDGRFNLLDFVRWTGIE